VELHLISPGTIALPSFEELASRVHPYVQAIHLRERNCTAIELYDALLRLQQLGVPAQKLVLNDRVDVGLAAGIGGVHLAHHSLPISQVKSMVNGLRIGRSVHSVEDALRCEEDGADYLIYGHIYASNSKLGLSPRGLASLKEVTEAVSIPVIAIGGIGPDQVQEVLREGAQGVAVISGIVYAADPITAAMQYASQLNERRSCHARNS